MSELVTGEAVALDLRTAALPSRVAAGAVDLVVQLVVLAGGAFLVDRASSGLSDAAAQALGVLLLVLVLLVLPITLETLTRGRTPGKAALGLRVVRDDGGPIGFRQAFVRGLLSAFLEKPGLTFFVLPVVVMLLDRRSKRVGDLLAGTVVVQERVPTRNGEVAQMPPQLAAWAATLELSRLPDELALSARSFVSRAGELTDAAREDLGSRLVTAVREVTAPPPPTGTPGWAFLAAVLAERRRRETARLQPGPPPGPPPGYAPPPTHDPSGYGPPPTYAPPGYGPPPTHAPPGYGPPPAYAPPGQAPPAQPPPAQPPPAPAPPTPGTTVDEAPRSGGFTVPS